MRVLVAGKGKSGKAVLKLLQSEGVAAEFVDDKILNLKKDELLGFDLDRLFCGLSFIVKSPGLAFDLDFFKEAKKRKIKVIDEFDFASSFLKSKNVIAVTGTNGKTTTVSLLYHILSDEGKKTFLGGNIGTPLSSFVKDAKQDDIVILECSSFGLEKIKNFHPHLACILNVTEDHLNRHKTMQNYLKCKLNICKNMTDGDFLCVNADDEYLMQNLPKTKAKILYFSTKHKVVGCYIRGNSIYFNDNLSEVRLLSLNNNKLVGEHNKSNLLASCLLVFLLTKNKACLSKANTFSGVAHRIEYVKTINGVAFYNDSKATNPQSTLVATRSFSSKICLLLGGSDKGYEFDNFLQKLPKNVEKIAIFGETSQKIANSAKKLGMSNYKIFDSFKGAIVWAYEVSKAEDVVLLSPACASFDYFKNYEERGSIFKMIVEEISVYANATSESNQKT